MVDRKLLSKGEMEVARALWEIGPASVREIHELVSQDKAVDVTTVQTYLRRIEAKGYAKSKLKGRARIYEAKTRAKTVIRASVEDFVDRLFGGDTTPLLVHLVEESASDPERIAQLRELVDSLEQKQKTTKGDPTKDDSTGRKRRDKS
ncbi:MAG TPA: transcriptional regulator [Planctomycetaceae bacterium]|nr:transcriptional regulator [Planctomycetaceae bacterium]